MKSLSAMLTLSAIGVAVLSTHALAQAPYSNGVYNDNGYRAGPLYDAMPGYEGLHDSGAAGVYGGTTFQETVGNNPVGGYPNPVSDTNSASSIESGAAFHLDRGYPAYYEFTDE